MFPWLTLDATAHTHHHPPRHQRHRMAAGLDWGVRMPRGGETGERPQLGRSPSLPTHATRRQPDEVVIAKHGCLYRAVRRIARCERAGTEKAT